VHVDSALVLNMWGNINTNR